MSLLALAAAGISGGNPTINVGAGIYTNVPGGQGSYQLTNGGDIIGSLVGDTGDWITPKAYAPGAYEVRATLNSGALLSGTTGSWLALSTTRTWTADVTGTANLTVEIRDGSGTVQDSGTVIVAGGGTI